MTRLRQAGSLGLRVSLTVLILAGASGCLSFDKRWEEAAQHLVTPGSIAGRWEGNWTSEESNRRGRLRCLVTPLKSGGYEARFHTVFALLIPFEHTVALKGSQDGGLWHFAGQDDLGLLAGGVYQYDGKASADRFFANYTSRYDKGTFELGRPQ